MASKLDEIIKQLGLTMEYEDVPEEKLKIAKLRDPKNPMKSADAMFRVSNDLYKDLSTVEPVGVFLPKEWQNKGLTTELYKELEKVTGGKMVPGDDQTTASYNLHNKRGYGKEFGIDESKLNKLMSPAERKERQLRQQALKGGLDGLVGEMDELSKLGFRPDDLAQEVYKSDVDHKLLGKTDPRNITSLLDNVLREARKLPSGDQASEFIKKQMPSALSKVKSVAPLLAAKGLAGLASGGMSLAAEAADTEEMGGALEQEALEREIAAQKKMKGIESADVPDAIKLKALEMFKKNKLPY